MPVVLTSQERDLLASRRLNDRPTYFNANTGTNIRISEDFEAFLVLRGKKANRTAAEWIAKSSELSETMSQRDGIVNEFLAFDRQDNEDLLEEIETDLAEFNAFQSEFDSGKFADATEVGVFLSDLQKLAGEVFEIERRSIHLGTLHSFATEILATQGLSTAEQQQIQSWLTPLLAY